MKPDRHFLEKDTYTFTDVVSLIAYLRSDTGCPWDRKQNHMSLRKNLIEEAYEGVDAILSNNPARIADEMGDILLQVVLHAQIGLEAGSFSIDDVTTGLCKKLIRRHTHLFGDDRASNESDALRTWEANKKVEKGQQSHTDVLADVPKVFPALTRAYKVQKKAAAVGFDWPDADGAREKVDEELKEIEDAPNRLREEEVGDFLFAAVNYVRLLGFEPEVALTRSTEKFISRFGRMEALATNRDTDLASLDLNGLDALWEQVKIKEREKEGQADANR